MSDDPTAPAAEPHDPPLTTTAPLNLPVTLTPSLTPPHGVNGNTNSRTNHWLIVMLGGALILSIALPHVDTFLLLWMGPNKELWDALHDFLDEISKQAGQLQTILASGLLGALTQKALDTVSNGAKPK